MNQNYKDMIAHLENLERSGATSVTLSVNHLLDVLRASVSNVSTQSNKRPNLNKKSGLDGGYFVDDDEA